jgi:hypothetical protein
MTTPRGTPELYVIGIGAQEDFEAGRGKLYIEERDNGRGLPVFYSHEDLERYVRTVVAEDLDADPSSEASALFGAGRYRMVAVEGLEELVSLAAYSSVEWLIWSLKPSGEVEGMYCVPRGAFRD